MISRCVNNNVSSITLTPTLSLSSSFTHSPSSVFYTSGSNKKLTEKDDSPIQKQNYQPHFYKTKLCPWHLESKCYRGNLCNWAHSVDDIRRSVDLTKTKLCPNLHKEGGCRSGGCRYAHHFSELKATTDVYKTSICIFWIKGQCLAGHKCRHAHGDSELRQKLETEVFLPEVVDVENLPSTAATSSNSSLFSSPSPSICYTEHLVPSYENSENKTGYTNLFPSNYSTVVFNSSSSTADSCSSTLPLYFDNCFLSYSPPINLYSTFSDSNPATFFTSFSNTYNGDKNNTNNNGAQIKTGDGVEEKNCNINLTNSIKAQNNSCLDSNTSFDSSSKGNNNNLTNKSLLPFPSLSINLISASSSTSASTSAYPLFFRIASSDTAAFSPPFDSLASPVFYTLKKKTTDEEEKLSDEKITKREKFVESKLFKKETAEIEEEKAPKHATDMKNSLFSYFSVGDKAKIKMDESTEDLKNDEKENDSKNNKNNNENNEMNMRACSSFFSSSSTSLLPSRKDLINRKNKLRWHSVFIPFCSEEEGDERKEKIKDYSKVKQVEDSLGRETAGGSGRGEKKKVEREVKIKDKDRELKGGRGEKEKRDESGKEKEKIEEDIKQLNNMEKYTNSEFIIPKLKRRDKGREKGRERYAEKEEKKRGLGREMSSHRFECLIESENEQINKIISNLKYSKINVTEYHKNSVSENVQVPRVKKNVNNNLINNSNYSRKITTIKENRSAHLINETNIRYCYNNNNSNNNNNSKNFKLLSIKTENKNNMCNTSNTKRNIMENENTCVRHDKLWKKRVNIEEERAIKIRVKNEENLVKGETEHAREKEYVKKEMKMKLDKIYKSNNSNKNLSVYEMERSQEGKYIEKQNKFILNNVKGLVDKEYMKHSYAYNKINKNTIDNKEEVGDSASNNTMRFNNQNNENNNSNFSYYHACDSQDGNAQRENNQLKDEAFIPFNCNLNNNHHSYTPSYPCAQNDYSSEDFSYSCFSPLSFSSPAFYSSASADFQSYISFPTMSRQIEAATIYSSAVTPSISSSTISSSSYFSPPSLSPSSFNSHTLINTSIHSLQNSVLLNLPATGNFSFSSSLMRPQFMAVSPSSYATAPLTHVQTLHDQLQAHQTVHTPQNLAQTLVAHTSSLGASFCASPASSLSSASPFSSFCLS